MYECVCESVCVCVYECVCVSVCLCERVCVLRRHSWTSCNVDVSRCVVVVVVVAVSTPHDDNNVCTRRTLNFCIPLQTIARRFQKRTVADNRYSLGRHPRGIALQNWDCHRMVDGEVFYF